MTVKKKQAFIDLLEEEKNCRFCGPSDDSDMITAVTVGYRNITERLKILAYSVLPRDLAEEVNRIDVDVSDIFSAYEARTQLHALMLDIDEALELGDISEIPQGIGTYLRPNQSSKSYERSTHMTPDMQLMFGAINKFWSNYDLSAPNPNIAPFKKDVVDWIISEAKSRGIEMSKSRAEVIDTIIRCPVARKGGNTR